MPDAPSVIDNVLPLAKEEKDVPFYNALKNFIFNVNNSLRFLLQRNVKSVTSDYIVVGSDYLVLVDATTGGVTISLPSVVKHKGQRFKVKKTDSSGNVVTLDGDGSETIDETTTRAVTVQYQTMTVISDGTEWWTI